MPIANIPDGGERIYEDPEVDEFFKYRARPLEPIEGTGQILGSLIFVIVLLFFLISNINWISFNR
ncbi:MAG: hypothetical protein ACXAE3_12225 [Candidatus Kariarchaeaceae archaeon]|jgi:hypothetical protein